LSFNINGLDSEETARILSERFNIAVRAGLHCAPLAHKSFNTLENGTVRAVASVFTTKEQINYFASCINKIINLKK
jgi:selenocysteine lyase/cysteine desulfurase